VAADASGNIAAAGNVNGTTSILAASPAGGSTAAGAVGAVSAVVLQISP
jgi:hypothetical protein